VGKLEERYLREGENLQDLDLDGRIILKYVLEKWNGRHEKH
jgi:hypothetical protein